MAEHLTIRPIMSLAHCRLLLKRPIPQEFSTVIVFLPRYKRFDGTWTNEKGLFLDFDMRLTFWGTDPDDFHLDEDMTANDYGTFTKSVYVSFEGEEYFEAFLYCRVKPGTPYHQLTQVMLQLNRHLDMFKDELRTGIAQEWAAQEPWRVMPRCEELSMQPVRDGQGAIVGWNSPVDNLVAVMKDQLPKGYGEDLPAEHIIN